MESALPVLIVLLLVLVAGAVARAFAWAPLPFVQIAFGAAMGLVPGLDVSLDPPLFFLLFIAPLLFLSGWRIPNDELFAERGAVLRLAIGLVVLMVLGLGPLIHWMIPSMPLAVAFALAAIVAPTDPVAVSSILGKDALPPRTVRILDGEAMLNDASGLSCLRIATAAAVTGAFSVPNAVLTFAWTAAGGVGVGVAVSLAATRIRDLVSRRLGDEGAASTLSALLVPFLSYLGAERIGCSGILAAAAAGIAMGVTDLSSSTTAETRIQARAVWGMLEFTLNGAIFVILGEQLPDLIGYAAEASAQAGGGGIWHLAAYVAAIYAALAAIRFAWVWTSLHVGARTNSVERRLRHVTTIVVAGPKGAITLAGALSLPLSTASGDPFPERTLLILLATGVILASLAVAVATLPRLIDGMPAHEDPEADEREATVRTAAIRAAIDAVGALPESEDRDAILETYRRKLALAERPRETAEAEPASALPALRTAIRAERDAVMSSLGENRIGIDLARSLVAEFDLAEARAGRR